MSGIQDFITSPWLQGKRTSRFITRVFGWLAKRRFPKAILTSIIKKYSTAFDVDLSEYDFDIQRARTFQEFFLRRFKKGARTFQGTLASPAEGEITESGEVRNGNLLQVKGKSYLLSELLQEDFPQAESFVTIYLGLGNYHHVHMPIDGVILSVKRISGHYFATNKKALARKPNVYCLNERVVLSGDSELGKFKMVLVGATVVGGIRLIEKLSTKNEAAVEIAQGERLAAFEMGSTVVTIFESNCLRHVPKRQNKKIKLGEKLLD